MMKKQIIAMVFLVFAGVAMTQNAVHSDNSKAEPKKVSHNEGMTMDQSAPTKTGNNMDKMKDHGSHDMNMMDATGHKHVHHQATAEEKKLIGVDEKLSTTIPMNLVFRMEDGSEKALKDMIHLPTLIVPIYYTCPNVCQILQSAVAAVLPRVKMKPGKDYQVLSISFDENDTPEVARQKKANYMAAMNHKFPEDAWHFLTADKATIDTFMNSIGFHFQRKGNDFIHPVVILAVTQDGKISRYIYGSSFLPFDVTMALTEASEGRSGLSVKRIVSYCFSYDPKGKKYVFQMTRVAGSIILIFAVLIFLMLVLGGRKKLNKE